MATSISPSSESEYTIPEKWAIFLFFLFLVVIGFVIGMILSLLTAFVCSPVTNLNLEGNLQENLIVNSYVEYNKLREQASIAQSEVLDTPIISQDEELPKSIKMLANEDLKIDQYCKTIFGVSLAIIAFAVIFVVVGCFENGIDFCDSGASPFITLMASLAITFCVTTYIFAHTQPAMTDDNVVNQELISEIEAKPMVADYLQRIDYTDSLFKGYLVALNQNDAENIDHYLSLGIDVYINQDTIARNIDRQYESLYYDN